MRISSLATPMSASFNVQLSDENNKKSDKSVKSGGGEEKTASTSVTNEPSMSVYNQKGQVTGVDKADQKDEGIFAKRERIKNEVWQQTYSMLQEAIARFMQSGNSFDPNVPNATIADQTPDPFGLGAYYSDHPEDWEKVQQGIVPDYFNIENTGQRILDIWMSQNGSQDVESLQSARQNIERAYDEVSGMFGGTLPQLVLDTRDYILKKLDGLASVTGEQT